MQINYKDGYQNWITNINNVLLYRYFTNKNFQETKQKKDRICFLQQKNQKNMQDQIQYKNLIFQLLEEVKNINIHIQQNLSNKELLNKLYEDNNVNISFESFMEWIKTRKRYLITF